MFLFFVGFSLQCGEIVPVGMPSGTLTCGMTFTLNLSYHFTTEEMNGIANYNPNIEAVIYHHNSILSDNLLGIVGTVEFPKNKLVVTIPNPYPAEWLSASSAVKNDGSKATYSLKIEAMVDYYGSSACCGLFCKESTFDMTCTGNGQTMSTTTGTTPPPPSPACMPGELDCACVAGSLPCNLGLMCGGQNLCIAAQPPCVAGTVQMPVGSCAAADPKTACGDQQQCGPCMPGTYDCGCLTGDTCADNATYTCANGRCVLTVPTPAPITMSPTPIPAGGPLATPLPPTPPPTTRTTLYHSLAATTKPTTKTTTMMTNAVTQTASASALYTSMSVLVCLLLVIIYHY